jgi:hypothetical protein
MMQSSGAMVGIATVLMAMSPGPAHALECLLYDIRASYWFHEEADETFVLVFGDFSKLQQPGTKTAALLEIRPAVDAEIWTATFTGFSASGRASDQPFEAQVTLVFPDYGVVAGGSDTAGEVDRLVDQTGLVWLKKTDDDYQLTADLCWPLIDADPESVGPALDCLAGRNCPKPG